jgi:hypothetical protein
MLTTCGGVDVQVRFCMDLLRRAHCDCRQDGSWNGMVVVVGGREDGRADIVLKGVAKFGDSGRQTVANDVSPSRWRFSNPVIARFDRNENLSQHFQH